MKVRGIVMPRQKNYYGFVDRLRIESLYRTGALRGSALTKLIEEGVLRVAPAALAYDFARWDPIGVRRRSTMKASPFDHLRNISI